MNFKIFAYKEFGNSGELLIDIDSIITIHVESSKSGSQFGVNNFEITYAVCDSIITKEIKFYDYDKAIELRENILKALVDSASAPLNVSIKSSKI